MIDSFTFRFANPRGPSRSLPLGCRQLHCRAWPRWQSRIERLLRKCSPATRRGEALGKLSRRRGRQARGCARHWTRIEREVRDGEGAIARHVRHGESVLWRTRACALLRAAAEQSTREPPQSRKTILVAALGCADVLLTLDRRDFGRLIGQTVYGLRVRTPGGLLREEREAGRLGHGRRR